MAEHPQRHAAAAGGPGPSYGNVRVHERLRIKIGEAKNLPTRSHGTITHRDPYCVISLDQEEIFRTSTMEKTLNPYFGEEFQFEVPRRFRFLSIYVFDRDKDRHLKQDKVLGKVAILREDLKQYNNNKDHWFALRPVDADSEVQGKAHIEILLDEAPPRITSISPDHHVSKESPKILRKSTDKSDVKSVDEIIITNQSVDRKISKAKKSKLTDYYKEGIKFGSCSSTSSKKLLSAITPESSLSRSESLKGGQQPLVSSPEGVVQQQPSGQWSSKYAGTFPDSLSSQGTQLSFMDVSMYPSLEFDTSRVGSAESYAFSENSPETLTPQMVSLDLRNKLSIRVIECSELTKKNGQCDPYAVVSVFYSNGKKVSKRTKVKKKTVNPQFDECFTFDLTIENGKERETSNNAYTVWPAGGWGEAEASEISVTLWHDSPGMGGEAVFLGEVRVHLKEPVSFSQKQPVNSQRAMINTSAWYVLRSRESQVQNSRGTTPPGTTPPGTRQSRNDDSSLGSLRLVLHHIVDPVLPPQSYDRLRALLLKSPQHKPITSSAVYILGEIISNKSDAAQPLVRLFTHEEQIVPIIRALADAELSVLTDATTIFRGNTLVSKMMDEAMRLTGLTYLQQTLRPTLDLVFSEKKPCEIDPTRVKDQSTVETNLNNLKEYVEKMFDAITKSFVHCPAIMCRLFDALRQCAAQRFPRNADVRYSVVSGFIFLRFFAPAILGPRLFDLTNEQIDPQTIRTLTLISKTIQSLGNLVSSQVCKEEYMVALYKSFCTEKHVQAIKRFLEIISSSTETQSNNIQETPVLLKEGTMIKKTHGRKPFGQNLKQRHFRLTNCELSYSKARGKRAVCSIPLADIISAQAVSESQKLKMINMFQIECRDKVIYVQAGNCVERQEWLDLLGKLCEGHQPPAHNIHPVPFYQGYYPCCSASKIDAPGCAPAVTRSPPAGIRLRLDPARDLQRIHFLLYNQMDIIEEMLMPAKHGNLGSTSSIPIEDISAYLRTLKELKDVTYSLEQEHRAYQRSLARETKYGSKQAPIGDDNYLHVHARADDSDIPHLSLQSSVKGNQMFSTITSITPSSPLQSRFPLSKLYPSYTTISPSLPTLPSKLSINSKTYLNNSLYIGSSTESFKSDKISPESKLSLSNNDYLKMRSLTSENSNTRIINIQDTEEKPPLPVKNDFEYILVKPKVPERDTKPKLHLYVSKEKEAPVEDKVNNSHLQCEEYELMYNFSSAAQKLLAEQPPAVPPRAHINISGKPIKSPPDSDLKLKRIIVTANSLNVEQNQSNCEIENFQDVSLKIVEPNDINEPETSNLMGFKTNVEIGTENNSDAISIIYRDKCEEDVNLNASDKEDKAISLQRDSDECQVNLLSASESVPDVSSGLFKASHNSDKKKYEPKEEHRFFSRKNTQRKSIPVKSKLSGKKTNSVDGGLQSTEFSSRPTKTSIPLSDRLTPSFLKRKSKVNSDNVRIGPVC